MGAEELGLSEEELKSLVESWRKSNPGIVRLWHSVDEASKKAVRGHTETETSGIKFICKSGMLFVELPSGRRLCYVKPQLGVNRFGNEAITYEGVGTARKWERLETYGGRLVENVVQAISRDILCNAISNMRDCYICGHVHDELIIECREDYPLQEICQRMATPPDWMQEIILNADGYITDFYKKE